MKPEIIKYIPFKKQLRNSSSLLIKVIKPLMPKKEELLFAFNGRNRIWKYMGSELYKNDPVFRESIADCQKIILGLNGPDILPNFEKTTDNLFQTESEIYFTTLAIQIALVDVLKENRVIPNATTGISLGETAAVYAAGGLSKKDALQIINSVKVINSFAEKEYCSLIAHATFDQLHTLQKEINVDFYPLYEFSKNHSIVVLHQSNLEILTGYLRNHKVEYKNYKAESLWPYHTPLISNFKEKILHYILKTNTKPLECDFYSVIRRKKFKKGTILNPSYWFEMQSSPLHAYSTFEMIKNEGKNFKIIQVGPDLFGGDILKNNTRNSSTPLLSTLQQNKNEVKLLENTTKKIKKSGNRNYRQYQGKNALEKYLLNYPHLSQEFIQEPMIHYKFLMRHGSVHFIPALNGFMVLNYDEVMYALNNPDKFSSRPYSSLEKLLVGADPPDHTKIRSLLQPLFTRKTFRELEETSRNFSLSLVKNFPKNEVFNLVDAFSIPLAKQTIGRFIGFSPEEESELTTRLTGHLYTSSYYDNLLDFLLEILKTHTITDSRGAIKHILTLINDQCFSTAEAASLLRLLWLAGITTTSSLISYSVLKLLENHNYFQFLKENPHQINRFIQECARLESPESYVNRITTDNIVLGQQKIPKNSQVFLNVMTANRDPKFFENPDDIDLNRTSIKHLAFGSGVHHCIGMPIANLEVKEALTSILEIYPNLNLNRDQKALYFPSPHLRALESVGVMYQG